MVVLLNLIFAILGGWLTLYLLGRAGAAQPVAVVVAVLVGILVYTLNIAGQVV